MKAKQRFSDDILADFREKKGLRIRAGTGQHRFIGIWVVVVNDASSCDRGVSSREAGSGRSWRNLAAQSRLRSVKS